MGACAAKFCEIRFLLDVLRFQRRKLYKKAENYQRDNKSLVRTSKAFALFQLNFSKVSEILKNIFRFWPKYTKWVQICINMCENV